MNTAYKHTQIGWVMIVAFFSVMLVVGGAAAFLVLNPNVDEDLGVAVAALAAIIPMLAILLLLFCTLTVRISTDRLVLYFGPGLIRKSIPLASIASVSPAANRWWYGFGVRITPHGWLYNVSGLKAVQISTWAGRSLRIGTDEPEALCRAIDQARAANPSA
jgi:hypothetical protein